MKVLQEAYVVGYDRLFSIKRKLPEFHRRLNPKDFFNWIITIERFFEAMDIRDNISEKYGFEITKWGRPIQMPDNPPNLLEMFWMSLGLDFKPGSLGWV